VLRAVVWWCLIMQPVVVRRPPHQILVAEPVQLLGRDVHPRRFRRGRGWGFRVHGVIVSLLDGEFRRRCRPVYIANGPNTGSPGIPPTFTPNVGTTIFDL
jgi:hypothetical protein